MPILVSEQEKNISTAFRIEKSLLRALKQRLPRRGDRSKFFQFCVKQLLDGKLTVVIEDKRVL